MRPSNNVIRMCPRSNAIKAIGKRVKNTINSSLISKAPGTDLRKNFVPIISMVFIIIKIAMHSAARIANHLVIFVIMSKAWRTKFLIYDILYTLLAPLAYIAGLPLKAKGGPLYIREVTLLLAAALTYLHTKYLFSRSNQISLLLFLPLTPFHLIPVLIYHLRVLLDAGCLTDIHPIFYRMLE
jgi:hypothetical protein